MNNNLVGIVPAAGLATRLGNLPFSKELFPLHLSKDGLKVASSHLINNMAEAGASQIHMVIREGKWDIPAYFGSSYQLGTSICYHIAEYGYGVPFTVHQAYPFVRDKNVLLGFPDILYQPATAFKTIVEELNSSNRPLVLGLFPVDNPSKFDMVEQDENNDIAKITIKPTKGNYRYSWIIAAWKPEFSDFLNGFILETLAQKTSEELNRDELHFGHVIISALENGMKAKGVVFDEGKSIDLGTPEDLRSYASFVGSE